MLELQPGIGITPERFDVAIGFGSAVIGFDPRTGKLWRMWMHGTYDQSMQTYDSQQCEQFAMEYARYVAPGVPLVLREPPLKNSNAYSYSFCKNDEGRTKWRAAFLTVEVERAYGTLRSILTGRKQGTPVGPDDPVFSKQQVVAKIATWFSSYKKNFPNAQIDVSGIAYQVPKDPIIRRQIEWYRQCYENEWSLLTYGAHVNDLDSWNPIKGKFDRFVECQVDATRGDLHSVITSEIYDAFAGIAKSSSGEKALLVSKLPSLTSIVNRTVDLVSANGELAEKSVLLSRVGKPRTIPRKFFPIHVLINSTLVKGTYFKSIGALIVTLSEGETWLQVPKIHRRPDPIWL